MKRILVAMLSFLTVALYSQEVDYARKYEMLVSRLGPSGVGVETLLDSWKKADSTNVQMLSARIQYYLSKSCSPDVVTRPEKNYLGMQPIFSLKDSTGTDVYYYQVDRFDDELFGMALSEIDNASALYPDMLDFRFMKANAYMTYEKESPDMALAYLQDLVREDNAGKRKWMCNGTDAVPGFFKDVIQEYCATLYTLGTPSAMEAFLKLSELMMKMYPAASEFITNVGSYHMKARNDSKTALKHYAKAIKKNPKDYPAVRNAVIAARKVKNVKQEKKYLAMLVELAPENEKMVAKARLEALNSK